MGHDNLFDRKLHILNQKTVIKLWNRYLSNNSKPHLVSFNALKYIYYNLFYVNVNAFIINTKYGL